MTIPALGQTWHRTQTLVAALAAIGVEPADVRYVAISHVHPDKASSRKMKQHDASMPVSGSWNTALLKHGARYFDEILMAKDLPVLPN